MELADFVWITVFKEDRGDPNMAMQNKTAIFPKMLAASPTGKSVVAVTAVTKTAKQAEMCCHMLPGKDGDLRGANLMN